MTDKNSNYTPAMEATIEAAADEGNLNQARATALAAELGKSPRSVIAKIVRMGLPYDRKVATTKSGEPVERKDAIVAEIAEIVGVNLDGLEKGPKGALQAVRDFLTSED